MQSIWELHTASTTVCAANATCRRHTKLQVPGSISWKPLPSVCRNRVWRRKDSYMSLSFFSFLHLYNLYISTELTISQVFEGKLISLTMPCTMGSWTRLSTCLLNPAQEQKPSPAIASALPKEYLLHINLQRCTYELQWKLNKRVCEYPIRLLRRLQCFNTSFTVWCVIRNHTTTF